MRVRERSDNDYIRPRFQKHGLRGRKYRHAEPFRVAATNDGDASLGHLSEKRMGARPGRDQRPSSTILL